VDLQLTPEQQTFRDRVRTFARTEVRPAADRCEPQSRFPRELLPRLAELGLLGLLAPRTHGGQGLDTVSACLAVRELAVACPSVAVTVHVNNFVFCAPLSRLGSGGQLDQFLAPAARGERLGAFALSEPDAGADPSRLLATARPDDHGYRLSGRKAWVTNGPLARSFLVVARVARDEGHDTALFIVDRDAPGLVISKPHRTLGLRSALVVDLVLDDVPVPAERLLGPEGGGLAAALETLQASRIGVAAQSVGIARGALSAAQRQDAGSPEQRQALAGAAADVEAANLVMLRAAWLVDQGPACPREASMAKLICSETAVRTAGLVLDHAGPEASRDGHPASRFLRDARVTTIYGGPSEIQRGIIARNLGRAAAENRYFD